MPLLQITDLIKYYGATPILHQANLTIQPGEKWGLIGRNGSGKTTLLRILTGEEDFDGGEFGWAHNCRVGYLKQEPDFALEMSIYMILRCIFTELDQLQGRLADLQQQMSQPELKQAELHNLIEEHHQLHEEFELHGGYQVEGRIQGVLRGLGFPKERWNDPVAVLSGGERTRLALAQILLTDNDLLLLDEPTNYLDLAAIEWLEHFMADFKGAILLISHDRSFLDRVVNGIYELEFCKVKKYKGNYTAYRQQKEANYLASRKACQEQEKELSRLEKFVRESRTDEKSKRKARSIEKRIARIELVEKPTQDNRSIKLEFKEAHRSSWQVLELEGVTKSFSNKNLLNEATLKIEAGEKVGLIGPNGAGKTTLLKMILGLEQPERGRIRLGHEVYPSYFSQLTGEEELTGTPFSQIMAVADLDNTEARTLLGRFLFTNDDVFKEVASLSGGERRRLSLLKLMLSQANLLILDEPTNHLDLDSIEIVEKALRDYEGTVLLVSHDRSFLSAVTDRLFAIIEGKLKEFLSYQDYLDWLNQFGQSAEEAKPKSTAQLYREQNKETQRDLKKKQRNLDKLEADINIVEFRKNELLTILNDPTVQCDYKKSLELGNELAEIEAKLDDFYLQWEQLQLE